MTVGDDLKKAARDGRLRSSRLIVRLKECKPSPQDLELVVNDQTIASEKVKVEAQDDVFVLTLESPPMRQGKNTLSLFLKPSGGEGGLIYSIDLNVDY